MVYDLSDRDANGEPTEYARFDGPEAVANPTRADVRAYSEYDEDKEVHVVRTADGGRQEYATPDELEANWKRIYLPFIPENESNRPPREDDFIFEVYPESANPKFDEPQLAARGEFQPLFPPDVTMPDVSNVVMPEDEEDDDDDAESDDAAPSTETADPATDKSESSDTDQTSGYDSDAVVATIVDRSALTEDAVAPVVAQVDEQITGLTHDLAVETVRMLLNIGLDDEDVEDESLCEADTAPGDAPSEAATATSDEGNDESEDTDQPTEDDLTERGSESSPSNASTTDSSPSEPRLKPAIVPVEEAADDESPPEAPVIDDTDTATPPSAPSDEERQPDYSAVDHPLIDPVAFTSADWTAVSQQRAREVTRQRLSEFETPTYPPVVPAVAEDLDVEIQLEAASRTESDTVSDESGTEDDTTETDFWGS